MIQTIKAAIGPTIRRSIRVFYGNVPRPIARAVAQLLPPNLAGRIRHVLAGGEPQATIPSGSLLAIRRELHAVRKLDPQLETLASDRLTALPVVRPSMITNIDRLLVRLLAQLPPDTKYLVLVGRLSLGGAEFYAASIYKSLVRLFGKGAVALVVTDAPVAAGIHWLGDQPNLIFLDHLQAMLDLESKMYLVRHMIATVRPTVVFNVNSHCLWNLMVSSGAGLRHFTDFVSGLFCYDYRSDGIRLGYAATHLRDSVEFHRGFVLDNEAFRHELAEHLALPASVQKRMVVNYTPLDPAWRRGTLAPNSPRRVIWAGRFVHQKCPILAVEVAKLYRSVQFDFYGGAGPPEIEKAMHDQAPPNTSFKGTFKGMESLPLGDYDAILYTSVTDGIPTVLLAAATAGLPIVATATGGIPELVSEDTGWPVTDQFDPFAYAARLAECLAPTGIAAARADRLQSLLQNRHSETMFDSTLQRMLEQV